MEAWRNTGDLQELLHVRTAQRIFEEIKVIHLAVVEANDMRFLMKALKNTKIAHIVKRNYLLKAIVKSIYKFFMFPFTRRGIDINIGGLGAYKLDYNFALRDYESFGDCHNGIGELLPDYMPGGCGCS